MEPDFIVTQENDTEEELFCWNSGIKMLFNPVLWGNFFTVFGISISLMGILFLVISGELKNTLLLMGGLFIFFGVIWVLTGVVFDLMGGFQIKYLLTSKGIYYETGKAEKNIATAVTVVGVLAGSAGTTGAGLLAKSEQSGFIDWSKVKKVKVRKGMRYIYIRKGFGTKPVGIYCNEFNFQPVLELVKSKCGGVMG